MSNISQKWIISSNLGTPPKILLQPVNSFTHIPLAYHWHYFATAAFITDQLKISFFCAVECVLAKKEIETFAEVAVHFPRSWLMGTV